ncbi:ketimine reductase mu-crystallin [Scaptodrosophila lebanonensis]|uniref:Ketimine reductase mu-crystallin n=1 Tax=Drosophila lebanonensis TaxID=7225 RepID=A0A6J2TTH3_DROLE|nr:ketimine reductase mu-crystallin [Scaptodrosophila lebanonensis]
MENNTPVFYNAETVRRVLNWPLVNEAVEMALKAGAALAPPPAGGPYVNQPQRSFTVVGNEPHNLLLTMPAFVGDYALTLDGSAGDAMNVRRQTLACKLVTSFRSNEQRRPPLPAVMANILLFNSSTGQLECIMDGTDITNWRTAAASLVATKYLYFRRFGAHSEQSREITVSIVGCGAQGRFHATAMCANFRVKQLNLWNRTEAKAVQLAEQLRFQFGDRIPISVCSSTRVACQNADVICIATYSREPLICIDDLSKERSIHINAVGAGEVHFGELANDIYAEAEVYVDSRASAAIELRDLPASIVAEVGEVILDGNYPDERALSVFQSLGMASEDTCVAQAVHEALMSGIK